MWTCDILSNLNIWLEKIWSMLTSVRKKVRYIKSDVKNNIYAYEVQANYTRTHTIISHITRISPPSHGFSSKQWMVQFFLLNIDPAKGLCYTSFFFKSYGTSRPVCWNISRPFATKIILETMARQNRWTNCI